MLRVNSSCYPLVQTTAPSSRIYFGCSLPSHIRPVSVPDILTWFVVPHFGSLGVFSLWKDEFTNSWADSPPEEMIYKCENTLNNVIGKWTGSYLAVFYSTWATLPKLFTQPASFTHSYKHFFRCFFHLSGFYLTFTHIYSLMDASESNFPKDIWHADQGSNHQP